MKEIKEKEPFVLINSLFLSTKITPFSSKNFKQSRLSKNPSSFSTNLTGTSGRYLNIFQEKNISRFKNFFLKKNLRSAH